MGLDVVAPLAQADPKRVPPHAHLLVPISQLVRWPLVRLLVLHLIGELLGREGHEFGATTGRPRRCGWFDAVVGRYSAAINGVDYWAMTKLDVLDTVETIKICTGYICDGVAYDTVPANTRILSRCEPVYEEMPGWMQSTKDVTRFEDLPDAAQAYVNRLCELTGVPLGILSVGPARSSTLRIAL